MYSNSDAYIATLNSIKNAIIRPERAFLYLGTNIDRLVDSHGDEAANVWKDFFRGNVDYEEDAISRDERLSPRWTWEYENPNPTVKRAIAGLAL